MNTGMYSSIHGPGRPLCGRRINRVTAMTLIEVLIVIVIMSILFSMLSGMMTIAQRQGKGTNTRATLMKVDQAIRLFRTDMRIYPWQVDLGTPPAEPAQWGNDLGWRLAWKPASVADRVTAIKDFHADVAAIERRFRFVNGNNVPPSGDSSEGSHAFRLEVQTSTSRTNLLLGPGSLRHSTATLSSHRWIPGTPSRGNDATGDAKALTKMAEEVTILAYIAGQMPTEAPTGIDATLPEDKARFPDEDERYPSVNLASSSLPFRYFPYNKAGHYGDDSRGPVLTTATARTKGWRGDYLASALRTTGDGRLDVDASGTTILDAWGRPLIYVCTVRPGVRGFMHGLTTNIFSGAREDRYNMGPQGREITELLDSDIRTTAGEAYIYEFELWSAGPDGQFSASRDNPVNHDNVALLPYTKGLR